MYWLSALALIFFVNNLILTYCQPDDFERGWQYGGLGGAKYMMPNFNPLGFFAHYTLGIFASGVMTWFGLKEKLREKLTKNNFFDITSLLGLAAFLTILWTQRTTPDFGFSLQNQPYYYPTLASSIALVLAVVPYSKFVGHILDNSFFRYTAKISFSLYIGHFFVMTLFAIGAGYEHSSVHDFCHWLLLTFFVIAITYLIASLSWYFIEKPILDAAHRKINRKKNHIPHVNYMA